MVLHVDRVELRIIELPLRFPFETSFGRIHSREIILITLYQDGIEGWGEAVTDRFPLYSEECNGTVLYISQHILIPLVLQSNWKDPGEWESHAQKYKGNPMAKCMIEMALWDLYGKIIGRSLSQIWGQKRKTIPVGISLGIEATPDALLKRIEWAMNLHYQRIKLKIKPHHDVEILRTVRTHFPNIALSVDGNAGYSLKEHESVLKKLDDFHLEMLEQPFSKDAWIAHAHLQKHIQTPICLDESLCSKFHIELMREIGAGRIVNIKPGRVGGYISALKMAQYCSKSELPAWCGGMLETGIGRAANVHLASTEGFIMPNDLSASDRYWFEDIIDPPFDLNTDGTLSVPENTGLGVSVRRNLIEKYAKWTIVMKR